MDGRILLNGNKYGGAQLYELTPPAQHFHVAGKLIDGSSDPIEGIGCADIILNNGIATINFDTQITTAGTSSSNYNWGISSGLISILNTNIPLITPLAGGKWNSDGYNCDLLFENTDFTPKSTSSDTARTYTLNNSVDKYDAVIVSAFIYVDSGGHGQLQYAFIPRQEIDYDIQSGDGWRNMFNGSIGASVRRLMFHFTSYNSIYTLSNYPESYKDSKIYKVWGIKFGGTSSYATPLGLYNEDSLYWTPGNYTTELSLLPSNRFIAGTHIHGTCYGTYDISELERGRIINGDNIMY